MIITNIVFVPTFRYKKQESISFFRLTINAVYNFKKLLKHKEC